MATTEQAGVDDDAFEAAWRSGVYDKAAAVEQSGSELDRIKAGCRAMWQAGQDAERQAATERVKAVLNRAAAVDESVPGWEDRSAMGWLEQSVMAAANVDGDRRKTGMEG